MKVHTDSVKSSIEREEVCMADLKREARRARKRVEGLDLNVDLDQLRDHLPEHLRDLLPAWNIMRQREEEAASKGFFSGFLLGVVVGAVLALIFAPQRGEDTRGLVKDKATELVHQVRGEADEAPPPPPPGEAGRGGGGGGPPRPPPPRAPGEKE